MKYDILATGSSGNAVVINGEIMIDIGIPFKRLRDSGYIKSLKLALLTHCHGDHFNPSTVRALNRERPALRWAACEWMVPHLLETGVDKRVIDVINPYSRFDDAMLYKKLAVVHPEFIPHDVPNCAWHIFDGKEHLFYATDCATLDGIEARDYDLYMIESNYTESEIKARIADKMARGEFAYELRAERAHLSMEQALEWLARNARPDSEIVFLHQHKERNDNSGKT